MDSFSPSELDWERISDILKGRVQLGPKIVTVDINSVCNLNCIFCRSQSKLVRHFPQCELRLNRVLKTIKSLVPLGLEEVNVSGDGEPILHSYFKRFIQELVDLGIKVNISTNLTILTEDVLNSLSKADSIGVNFCSFSNYKLIHGRDLASQVVRNLISLISFIRDNGSHTSVDIDFVLSRPTLRYAFEVTELAKRLGIGVEFVMVYGEDLPKGLFFESEKEFKPVLRQIHSLYPQGTNAIWFVEKTSPFSFSRCFIGWFHCFIDVFGGIHFCCQHPGTQFAEWQEDFKTLWFSPNAQKKRDSLTHLNPRNCHHCNYCAEGLLLSWVEKEVRKREKSG